MEIREKIENILTELVPGINLKSDNLLAENGVQSLTMIHLISELDIVFDIEITFDDIENGSFQTLDTIENMVRRYLK